MTGDKLKEQIEAFAPLLISIVLLVNTFLSAKGLPCIGLTDENITTLVSGIASAVAVIYTWWTNNNVTEDAQISQLVLKCMKDGLISGGEVRDFLINKMNDLSTADPVEVADVVERSEKLDDDIE